MQKKCHFHGTAELRYIEAIKCHFEGKNEKFGPNLSRIKYYFNFLHCNLPMLSTNTTVSQMIQTHFKEKLKYFCYLMEITSFIHLKWFVYSLPIESSYFNLLSRLDKLKFMNHMHSFLYLFNWHTRAVAKYARGSQTHLLNSR